jgi:hypothetical protein
MENRNDKLARMYKYIFPEEELIGKESFGKY